ncbi:hypothetical protein TWF730_002571 [Orbilia blumenaviensis]|uniref:Ankyrin n=1 Tax=Orbilia blumenaviensis TaxID=1796055 RepID=A0AAV9UEG4_9PEZI
MSSSLSPSSDAVPLAPRQAQPSHRAGHTPTPTSENSLAGATASHERAEHPLKGTPTSTAASLKLETSVTFSSSSNNNEVTGSGGAGGGGAGGWAGGRENEDLDAKLSYWKSRQEHVDAIDFYRFAENGGSTSGKENTAVGSSPTLNTRRTIESTGEDSTATKYAAVTANITPTTPLAPAEDSPVSEKMVTIVGKRILPPRSPPLAGAQPYTPTTGGGGGRGGPSAPALPPKIPAYKAWFSRDDTPRVPPKIPILLGSGQDIDASFESENSNYTITTTPTPTPWTYRTPPPPPPPRLRTKSGDANANQSQTPSSGEPSSSSSFSYRREADKIISKYTKSLSHTSPSDRSTEALINDINKQIDLEFRNLNLTEGQKINAIAKYVHEREKLRSEPTAVEPKTRSSNIKNIFSQSAAPSSERLDLRSTMTSMQRATIGSRASLKLGLDLVMRYYTSSSITPTNITATHLTSIISNISKPDGLGLAEMSLGFSFMHMCVRLNKLELVKELIEVGGANHMDCGEHTQTLMRNAIWYADADMVEYLISKGEDINARSHHDSISPLHHAVAAHNFGALKVLINAGADVNSTVRKNRKDIALICRKRNANPDVMVEILQTLLNNGGNLVKSADGGITPALLTGASGNERVLEILKSTGAERDDINKLRDFVLSAAIVYNDVSKVKELIEEGCDLNRRDIFRWRPLDSAASYQRVEIEAILAAAGALPASKKKDMERRRKKGSGTDGGGYDERGSSDWSAIAIGDRSDPEEWETGKDFRVKSVGRFK